MIPFLLLVGVAVVLPLATGGRWMWWWLAAGCAGAALLLPRGAGAAVLVLPWLAVAGWVAWGRLRALLATDRAELADGARVVSAAYAAVAAVAFAASRLGAELFGIGEPIVELTAVHYTYAGCAALALAAAALDRTQAAGGRGWRTVAQGAVVLTAGAPPVVALGFVAGAALPQVGGAVLMTLGVWATASLHLREAAAGGGSISGWRRVLLVVSGLSVWAPMVLAVAWAAGQHWDVPFLSIPDMAQTHGVANALGFTVAGLLARRPEATSAVHLGRLSTAALGRRLAAASAAAGVTYADCGCTLLPGAAPSFTRALGHGQAAFDGAARGLREWAPQRALGARVHPPTAPIETGTSVLIVLRAGPFEVVAPDRIVACVDEPGRFGFAYGTLPGHLERGEESFVVRLDPEDGTVTATITVVAGPASRAAAATGPVLRILQRRAVRSYLAALHRAAA